MLQKTDLSGLSQVRSASAPAPRAEAGGEQAVIASNHRGEHILSPHDSIDPPGWSVGDEVEALTETINRMTASQRGAGAADGHL